MHRYLFLHLFKEIFCAAPVMKSQSALLKHALKVLHPLPPKQGAGIDPKPIHVGYVVEKTKSSRGFSPNTSVTLLPILFHQCFILTHHSFTYAM